MLNIPEEVKQLFRQGSVKKNIRVHFPNGEREDITNSNIIAESFSFTESIMSQDTLKFGLCEASMVEFETFDIENIKGSVIEITLEVSNGKEWFYIPIGTFTVNSCKKQSNITRRQVVAISVDFDEKIQISEFEKIKQATYSRKNVPYTYQLIPYLYNNMNGLTDTFITGKTLVESENEVKMYQLNVKDGNELYARAYIYGKAYNFYYNNRYDSQEIIGVKSSPESLYSYVFERNADYLYSILEIESFFQLYSTSFINTLTGATYSIDYGKKIKEYLKKPHIYMQQQLFITENSAIGNDVFFSHVKNPYLIDSNEYYFYPEINNFENDDKDTAYMMFFIPTKMQVNYYSDGEVAFDYEYGLFEGDLYECTVNDFMNPVISIDRNAHKNYGVNVYTVIKEQNLRNLVEPFLELNGLFGKISRKGEFKTVAINNDMGLYPAETLYPSNDLYPRGTDNLITKAMYKTAWYDDAYVPLYSKITCSYTDKKTGAETYIEHIIIETDSDNESNYQTYDLSDNELIKQGLFTEEQIIEILSNMEKNIDRIRYMPSNIELIGLPYLEAGDVVRFLTTDGGFETIILNRTLSGIQRLSDNYESRG